MELKDLLETSPSTLANTQHSALKEHVMLVLAKVRTLIHDERYDEVEALTSYSPAGDGMGLDNSFIDFKWDEKDKDGKDIKDVVSRLIALKSTAEHSKY